MPNRQFLGVLTLVALGLSAGCIGLLGDIPDDQLCESAPYDYDTETNATYTIETNGTYRAVYDVSGQNTFELYKTDGLGIENPLQISAIEFRAENGTSYDCDSIEVETTRDRTVVSLPGDDGQFAYTAQSTQKRFSTHPSTNGSHAVILPKNRSVENPVFGNVRPGGYETREVDGRVHIRWDSVEAQRISIRYYMDRDIPLFLLLVTGAGSLAAIGFVYYFRLVRRLRRRREAVGPDDVEVEEDERNPPPGMG